MTGVPASEPCAWCALVAPNTCTMCVLIQRLIAKRDDARYRVLMAATEAALTASFEAAVQQAFPAWVPGWQRVRPQSRWHRVLCRWGLHRGCCA